MSIVNIFTWYNLAIREYGAVRFMENKKYIKRIRDLREDHDKTQQNVAEALGTSQTMYARYERGATELPIRHLISLCRYYSVSADYILGLNEEN